RTMVSRLGVALSVVGFVLLSPMVALAHDIVGSQTTASYKLDLSLGPAETMLTPDQEKTATQGEVMVAMPGMAMPTMSMTDQGQTVNPPLEIHRYGKASGNGIKDKLPAITIPNQGTGASRKLEPVGAMYGVGEGQRRWAFGGNVYLPDGKYTI